MQQRTIIVVGGGYAGLHTIESLCRVWKNQIGREIRLILLDKQTYHFKKVRLVEVFSTRSDLRVPFTSYGWEHVEIVQGELTDIQTEQRLILFETPKGDLKSLSYDQLVIAIGSTIQSPPKGNDGFVLQKEVDGEKLQQALDTLIRQTQQVKKPLLPIVVVGGGITGIEIAGELASYLRKKAPFPVDQNHFRVHLLHAGERLLPEASKKVADQLEQSLNQQGVKVVYRTKVQQYQDGVVTHHQGEMKTQLCIWALGTQPNPLLQHLGLPIHPDGRLIVDAFYRVQGHQNIYAIGDCARVVDPRTGKVDGMNCKEAIMQAKQLAKVMKAFYIGRKPTMHHNLTGNAYCIALGAEDGFLWIQRWGMEFTMMGPLARKGKEFAWKISSQVK